MESDQAITAFQGENNELNSKITFLKYLNYDNFSIPSFNSNQMLLEERKNYLVQGLKTDSLWVHNKMQIQEFKSKIIASIYESDEDTPLKINEVFGFIGIFRGYEEINDDYGEKNEEPNYNSENSNHNHSFIKIEIIYMKSFRELLLPNLRPTPIKNMENNIL